MDEEKRVPGNGDEGNLGRLGLRWTEAKLLQPCDHPVSCSAKVSGPKRRITKSKAVDNHAKQKETDD